MRTILALCVLAFAAGCVTVEQVQHAASTVAPVAPVVPAVVPAVPMATNTPAAQPTVMLPKPAAICAPERGVECPTPWGKDIRAIATDGNGKFFCFVGCDAWAKSLSWDGTTVTAAPSWTRNGITYVCYGVRVPKSGGPLIEALSAKYRKTTRFYYWPTREVQP